MISITVLYKDLTSKKVPIDQIDTLPKDDVLFIKLSSDARNISQIIGYDNYAVLKKHTEGDDWFMLYGWDTDEYIWRRECSECENREVVDAPIGTMHVIFRGVAVTDAKWKKALLETNKL